MYLHNKVFLGLVYHDNPAVDQYKGGSFTAKTQRGYSEPWILITPCKRT